MGNRRNKCIGGGAGVTLTGAWAAYSNFTTIRDLPADAGWAAKMMADPPVYAPYILLTMCVLFLAWLFWSRPDQGTPMAAENSSAASTSGPQSPAIGINHGTINFAPPNPAPVEPAKSPYGSGKSPYTEEAIEGLARALRGTEEHARPHLAEYDALGLARFVKAPPKRDVGLSEALAYAQLGEWGQPFIAAAGTSANDVVAHLSRFRQLAHDGELSVWGRRSEGGVFERVDKSHWIEYGVEWFDLLRENPRTENNQDDTNGAFFGLMVNKAEFEREWPRSEEAAMRVDAPVSKGSLIAAGRDWAHEFTLSANGDSFGFREFLEGQRLFSDLRPHLSAEYLNKLNAQRTSYANAEGARYPALVSSFLDELDRLEGEWNLR